MCRIFLCIFFFQVAVSTFISAQSSDSSSTTQYSIEQSQLQFNKNYQFLLSLKKELPELKNEMLAQDHLYNLHFSKNYNPQLIFPSSSLFGEIGGMLLYGFFEGLSVGEDPYYNQMEHQEKARIYYEQRRPDH